MPRLAAAWSARREPCGRMNYLMLILSFSAVFALFVSVCGLIVFVAVKLVRMIRAYRDRPRYVGIAERYHAPYLQENFKRAGQ
jgi:hypothetical protein